MALRLGIIGTDTTHSVGIAQSLRNLPGPSCAATSFCGVGDGPRARDYTSELMALGLTEAESIDALLGDVDGVLILSGHGGDHLGLVQSIAERHLPFFLDKPAARTLTELHDIVDVVSATGVRATGASALRFAEGVTAAREAGAIGVSTFGPCYLEPDHSDLFWYGIHGIELMGAVLGRGCQSVVAHRTDLSYAVIATWSNGCQGTYHGSLAGPAVHGGLAFTGQGTIRIGGFDGFDPLAHHIEQFFTERCGSLLDDFVESHRIAEAAQLSARQGGRPVAIDRPATDGVDHRINQDRKQST